MLIDETLRGEFPIALVDGPQLQTWEDFAQDVERRLADAERVAGLVDKPLLTNPSSGFANSDMRRAALGEDENTGETV